MALITSDYDAMRSPSIKWPESPRIVCPSDPQTELRNLIPIDHGTILPDSLVIDLCDCWCWLDWPQVMRHRHCLSPVCRGTWDPLVPCPFCHNLPSDMCASLPSSPRP